MKIVIVAGGTGGHIFPAIAFGQWLLRTQKASSVDFICGNRPLEIEIYRSANIEPIVLPIEGSPLGVAGILKKIKRAFALIKSFFYVKKILRKKNPHTCFIFGSYVSLTALLACHILRVPTVAHEQNSVMGKVAKLAKKLGKTVVMGWDKTMGIPVRPFEKCSRAEAMQKLNIPEKWEGKKIVGVLGGSLASGTLTKILSEVAVSLPECLFLVLSAGVSERENMMFIGRHWDMNPIFSLINLAICRGGASTLAELAEYEIPCVVVPWEKSADGHQVINAGKFAEITQNFVWRENDDAQKLAELISQRGGNPEHYKSGFHDKSSEKLFTGV